MSKAFGHPLLVGPDGKERKFSRISLGKSGFYTEADLRDTLYRHPSMLPIEELDEAFLDLVPICTELPTGVGPLDLLYVTPAGRLVCVETKLWRNPEARRKVVGQISDYAAELSRYSFEDLERQVHRRTKRSLLDFFRERPNFEEAAFCDGVTRNLRNGRMLLIICGDGIRESTANITRFLDRSTSLELTFALVEMAIYQADCGTLLFQPRTLAKTENIRREIFVPASTPLQDVEGSQNISRSLPKSEIQPQREFWLGFWQEVEDSLDFDDPNHLAFKPERRSTASGEFPLNKGLYLLIYFQKSAEKIGVSISMDATERRIFESLLEERDEIEREVGQKITWTHKNGGRYGIGVSRGFLSAEKPEERIKAVSYFADMIALFDTVFRPRLERIQSK